MRSLASGNHPRAAALRIWKLTGVAVEDASMPKVVNEMFSWAHYGTCRLWNDHGKGGKGSGKGKNKPCRNRMAHLALLKSEFSGEDTDVGGIQGTMRRELAAVEAAVKTKLSLNGAMSEVDRLPMMPFEMKGCEHACSFVSCSRSR